MFVSRTAALVLDVPEFFADPEFVKWLNNSEPKFTWHQGGEPGDYSDVVVAVDPTLTGEGSDSDTMPEHIWDQIIEVCRKEFSPGPGDHILVWLKNLP